MRSLRSGLSAPALVRTIVGTAPVLHFPNLEPKAPKDVQVKKNTNLALYLIKKFKGPLPKSYARRHAQTFDVVEKEIEALLGGAEKMRKNVSDDLPMDKISLIERCLRHAQQSFLKEEGKCNFAELEKWLVYTPLDQTRLSQLRRDVELKEKYAAFKARRKEAGGAGIAPQVDWAKEYAAAVDREVVSEKRVRYDSVAANTTERDDAAVEALLKQYRQPLQDQRLDNLIDLLERFKPVLAREAIMQRLTIKHLEGQLGIWRYLDWNPEVRDRAETETDCHSPHWWNPNEESRMVQVRLRSKNEVTEVMEKKQHEHLAAIAASRPAVGAGADSTTASRDKLLREVLQIQARIGRKDDDSADKKDDKKKAHH